MRQLAMSVTARVGLFIRGLYHLGRALSVATVILLAATTATGWAIGPSFDCDKVTTPLARFICATPDLSQTDLEFVQPYYALRQEVGPAGWQALKVEAVDFQSRVAQRCGIAPSGALPPDSAALTACLRRGYAAQRSVGLSRLSGAALEEARRPIEEHVALQGDLQALGLLPPSATIDGVYGEATRAAIMDWQRSRNMPATGLFGDNDARRLAQNAPSEGVQNAPDSRAKMMTDNQAKSTDRVAADKRASQLAYDADKGDDKALDELRAGAKAQHPSSLYGLSQFYPYQRARTYGPTTYVGLVDSYHSQTDPHYKEMLERRRSAPVGQIGHESDDDAAMGRIVALLQSAADLGDPAAQAELGAEYFFESLRDVNMMVAAYKAVGEMDPTYDSAWIHQNPYGIMALRTFTRVCSKAKSLMQLSMNQNWPEAFVKFSFVHAFQPPLPPLLSEAGCLINNPDYAEQLTFRAAELGSAVARWELRQKYLDAGRTADAAVWEGRLRELANGGDRYARDLLPYHAPRNP
jgi:peptidoglycan hydrolase-like protein with peptidoglycan-binding domain